MDVNFIASNDTRQIRTVHVWRDNEEIRPGNDTNDISTSLINSFLSNYQTEEAILKNGSNFVFESVDLLTYYIHKTNMKTGKSYIKPSEWLAAKKATTNSKNNDDKCFQYAITVVLNHQKIENHPERISNIKHFINQYNWKGINFPARKKDWRKFEQNNESITINILFVPKNEETINIAYKSKYNCKRKNQVVLLMITNHEKNDEIDKNDKWHYIALKSERTDDGFN